MTKNNPFEDSDLVRSYCLEYGPDFHEWVYENHARVRYGSMENCEAPYCEHNSAHFIRWANKQSLDNGCGQ